MRSPNAARTRENSGAMCRAMPSSVSGPSPSAAIADCSSCGMSGLADDRPHVDQFRKKRAIERALQIIHAGAAAGARLVADDAFDGLHVAKTPELKALLDVDELLAHVVGVPPLLRIFVDRLQNGNQV